MGLWGWASVVVLLGAWMPAHAQQSSIPPAQSPAAPAQTGPDRGNPALTHRPPPTPGVSTGRIKLDVLVTDASGHPVAGLEQKDFTLFDNKKPQTILSFHANGGPAGQGATATASPAAEMILLVDFANTSFQRAAYTRYQISQYLRQNGGHLTQPTSLMLFFDQGIQAQPTATTDGNLLAQQLDQSETAMHTIPLARGYDAIDRLSLSMKALNSIAAVEARRPGRKMLLWVGPGWPMLESPAYNFSARNRQQLFNNIVEMSRALFEARITLYSVHLVDPGTDQFRAQYYRDYLKPVASAKKADAGNLALPVFAIHSGGLAFDAGGDLVKDMNICAAENGAYYTLSFDPPDAEQVDEYHELQVQVDKPNMKARTNAGYYAQPVPKP